jgi:putative ABC transport system ATP-binding protein
MAILEGKNLRKTYRLSKRNCVEALKNVEISIDSGEMVAIMGPSGSGKSTLMHILGLLHAPDPGSGDGLSLHGPAPELRLGGEEVASLSDNARTQIRARRMGFVFQDFNLVPTLTAIENVMLACDYAGIRGKAARQAGLEALGLVGLADRADHKPSELSGGEQQRVALARALVNDPVLLVADEPTGNLDHRLAQEVMKLFVEISLRGTTVLVATHDQDLIRETSRRCLTLDGGRVVEGLVEGALPPHAVHRREEAPR